MAEQLQNFGHTTLDGGIDDTTTSVAVVDGSVFPSSGNFRINVEDELMLVTARSTNTLTVTRGAESTSAAAHTSGTQVDSVLTAGSLAQYVTENGGGSLTVTDESGTVSDAAVTSITVPDGTLVDNGTGLVTLREVPTGVVALKVLRTTDQTVTTATWTQATFGMATEDPEGGWSDANDEYTVPAGQGGMYAYTLKSAWDFNSTGKRYVALRVDDVPAAEGSFVAPGDASTNGMGPSGSGLVRFAAGDTVQVYLYHDRGADLDSSSVAFTLYKLGSGTVGETIGASMGVASSGVAVSASTATAIPWDGTEDWDTDGFHDPATNNTRFTVPAGLGGKYLMEALLKVSAPSGDGTKLYLPSLYVNGSLRANLMRDGFNGSSDQYYGGLAVIDLVAGDYVEVYTYNTEAKTITGERWTATLLATQGANSNEPRDCTAFPASPTTGMRRRRTDLDYMVFFYDGTRWLSEELFTQTAAVHAVTANTVALRFGWANDGLDVYVVDHVGTGFVATTNSGAHYWDFIVYKTPTNGAGSSSIGNENTSTWSPDVATKVDTAIGAVIDVSVTPWGYVYVSLSDTPGAVQLRSLLRWRYIAT